MTAPDPSNVLSGAFDSSQGSSGTLLTVPAGKAWRGRIVLNATGSVAASGSAVSSRATVSVTGSGSPAPASGTVIAQVFITVPAQAASTTGCLYGETVFEGTLIADKANALTVTATKNSVTSFTATAYGEFIV